jgi:hypothetical protein
MAVHTPAAYGMYYDDVSLQRVVHTLNRSGFDNEQICLMVRPRHYIAAAMRESNILNSDRAASATTVELIGWLMKLGAVVIPDVGFYIRSRAFLQALVMRKDSPAMCGNSRALVGLGFSEEDAERFERELREMGVLIYVSCPENATVPRAVEALRRTGAKETAALEAAALEKSALKKESRSEDTAWTAVA